MKKIILAIVVFIFTISLLGCVRYKIYTGVEVESITYKSVKYNGGYTVIHNIDFKNNKVGKHERIEMEIDTLNPLIFDIINTFSEKEEKEFIDTIYSYGLFDIKDKYINEGIIDGSGFTLEIKFKDGTSKISTGDNDAPTDVFNKCAIPFYKICKEQVLGHIPLSYFSPPDIDIAFEYTDGNNIFSTNTLINKSKANYKWNDFSEENINIWDLNQKLISNFNKDINYKLVLYTSNYHNYEDVERFNNIILKCYDFDEKLSNEKILLNSGWFTQKELQLELNKIYVYKLTFKNGDFVEYTFNTMIHSSYTLNQVLGYNKSEITQIIHYGILEDNLGLIDNNLQNTINLLDIKYTKIDSLLKIDMLGSIIGFSVYKNDEVLHFEWLENKVIYVFKNGIGHFFSEQPVQLFNIDSPNLYNLENIIGVNDIYTDYTKKYNDYLELGTLVLGIYNNAVVMFILKPTDAFHTIFIQDYKFTFRSGFDILVYKDHEFYSFNNKEDVNSLFSNNILSQENLKSIYDKFSKV